jgi:hypothetical protein
MKAYLISLRAVTGVAFVVVAALAFGGAAQAITDTVFRYSTPRSTNYSVDHFAMVPDRTAAANSNYNNSFGSGLTIATEKKTCFVTGINLPHGATVTAVKIDYVNGASSGGDLTVDLVAHKFGGVVETLGSKTFGVHADIRKFESLAIAPGTVINNGAKSYGLFVCLVNFQKFYGARITYTATNAGD